MTGRRRYLVLVPSFGSVVAVVMLGSGPLSGDALLILVLSALLLAGTVVVWTRREGLTSPVPIVALGLLAYFPLRGILLLTSGLTPDEGINRNVLTALGSTGPLPASLDVLMIAALFALACEAMWRLLWRRPPVSRSPAGEARDASLAGWGSLLLVVGLVGVILEIPKGIGFLQGDEISGGLPVQLIGLAGFSFGLGLILSGRANRRFPPAAWLLFGAVAALSFYMGSKDTLVQPLLALLFAGATVGRARRSKGGIVMVSLVAAVLVFAVFPAVTTYRRLIIDGQTVTQALPEVPAELVSKTAVMGEPRTGGPAGYVADSLLYMTNRLNGFDMLLLTTHARKDPQLLTAQTILLSPLGLVIPSGYWSSSPPQTGHYFGQEYWGSVPSNNVSIAITIFGEAQLAFGTLAVPVAAVVLGILAALAARRFRSASRASRAAGFVLMVTAVGFERDVLNLLITTERRLALLGIVVGLAAIGRRRITPPPWRLTETAPSPLAGAGARQ